MRSPLAAAVAGILLLAATASAPTAQPPAAPADEMASRADYARLLQEKLLLERETRLKELQLSLSQDDEPYLLFDLEEREIRVYVRVTPVKSFPLTAAEIEAMDADYPAAGAEGWVDRELQLVAKSGDDVAPERIEPPKPDTEGEAEEVDPRTVTPELAGLKEPEYPESYTMLYRQGVAVRISGESAQQAGRSWVRQKAERLASLLIRPDTPTSAEMESVRTWLHLQLAAGQARELYPSAFTGMRAMIRLPGDPPL